MPSCTGEHYSRKSQSQPTKRQRFICRNDAGVRYPRWECRQGWRGNPLGARLNRYNLSMLTGRGLRASDPFAAPGWCKFRQATNLRDTFYSKRCSSIPIIEADFSCEWPIIGKKKARRK
jgi:hypothetical protein